MKNQRGFILIELIAAIVLTGVIASFATFFLYTGFNGYEKSKNTSEGALKAQMALDRITLELRNIDEIESTPEPSDTAFTYKSEVLTGTRTLRYVQVNPDQGTIFINVNNTDYALLNDVSSFSLSYTYLNLDNAAAPQELEVARIDVGFKLSGIGRQFTAGVFPRNLVPKTW